MNDYYKIVQEELAEVRKLKNSEKEDLILADELKQETTGNILNRVQLFLQSD